MSKESNNLTPQDYGSGNSPSSPQTARFDRANKFSTGVDNANNKKDDSRTNSSIGVTPASQEPISPSEIEMLEEEFKNTFPNLGTRAECLTRLHSFLRDIFILWEQGTSPTCIATQIFLAASPISQTDATRELANKCYDRICRWFSLTKKTGFDGYSSWIALRSFSILSS